MAANDIQISWVQLCGRLP